MSASCPWRIGGDPAPLLRRPAASARRRTAAARARTSASRQSSRNIATAGGEHRGHVGDDRGGGARDDALHAADVVRDPRLDLACPGAREEGEREALEVAVDLPPAGRASPAGRRCSRAASGRRRARRWRPRSRSSRRPGPRAARCSARGSPGRAPRAAGTARPSRAPPRSGSGPGPTPRRQPVGPKEPEQPAAVQPRRRSSRGLSTAPRPGARAVAGVGGEPDQQGREAARRSAALSGPSSSLLGAPRSPRAARFTAPPPVRGQLDEVAAPVGRVRRARTSSPSVLELVEQGHQVARIDPQRAAPAPAGRRPGASRWCRTANSWPPQPALAEARPSRQARGAARGGRSAVRTRRRAVASAGFGAQSAVVSRLGSHVAANHLYHHNCSLL